MAVKSIKKSQANKDSLADVSTLNDGTLKKAALFKVSSDGSINKDVEAAYFKLNPDSYEDSKSANWALQNVPGQSDPVLQWTGSGPRTISFEALVTADTSYYDTQQDYKKPGEETDPLKKTLNVIGDIASAFFKITLPPSREPLTGTKGNSLDISNYLNYYRSMLYPEYGAQYSNNLSKSVTKSPPLLVLYSGNNINKLTIGSKITTNTDVWVLTDLKIRITKQLPNLAPMEATVQFTLVQYNIRSFDARRFL